MSDNERELPAPPALDPHRWLRRVLMFRPGTDATTVALWFFLAALGLATAAYLIWGTKPWDDGITRRIAKGRDVRVKEYASAYSWWAAAANLGVLVASLRRPLAGTPDRPGSGPPARTASDEISRYLERCGRHRPALPHLAASLPSGT